MLKDDVKQTVLKLCPDIDNVVIADFIDRMDDDYFATFAPEEIAGHIRMSSTLPPNRPIKVQVRRRATASEEFDVVIVGFDYLSEFSIFCGLLSAFGLDIRAGNIYSFSRQASRGQPGKVVDVFSVALRAG